MKINRTVIGFPDFHTKLVQAAATGKFPDIAAIDNADVPVFASQGALADVMQYFEVAEGPVPAGRAGKHQIQRQGLRHPVPEQHHALWYNQDAFIEAGITTRRSRPERLAPYLFVLPAILYPGALLVYPIAVNVLTSFQQLTAINLLSGDADWVGLGNYRTALHDPLVVPRRCIPSNTPRSRWWCRWGWPWRSRCSTAGPFPAPARCVRCI